MRPVERVFGTILGKPVDRVPFTITTSLYGAKLTDCPLTEYYASPTKYCLGQTAVVDQLEPDILFSPFTLVTEAEAFGSVSVLSGKNAPNLKIPAINDYSEIKKLKLPDPESHPGLMYLLESTRLLAEKYKDQIPVAAICTSPTELPALIMGIEGWIDTLLFHQEEARQMMELTSLFFVRFANSLLAAGASCIITFANFSNPTIITRKIAEESMLPVLRQNYAQVNGPIIFHHGGAWLLPFLDLYPQLPNLAGVVISTKDSFNETREIVGNNLTIFGNLNGPLLWKMDTKTVESKVISILENRKNDQRFILATSNADISYDTPLENLKVITRTMKRNQTS